ncbi:MAG: dihydrofolate reductase [Lactobacillales bacterium]|jgi:dihydrofolate reductase|nr:dihydrofolate reductase [Lactobacillales bacterium]
MLIAIWAQDENGLIGKDYRLPWHLPEDLRRFKEVTQENVLVMGRKTYEGMGKRPLLNRKTIVLTQNKQYDPGYEDVLVMNQAQEVLNYEKDAREAIFIAGGSQVYKAFEPYLDKLFRTVIHHLFDGDAYFPTFDYTIFEKVESKKGLRDARNPYDYDFETFVRRA